MKRTENEIAAMLKKSGLKINDDGWYQQNDGMLIPSIIMEIAKIVTTTYGCDISKMFFGTADFGTYKMHVVDRVYFEFSGLEFMAMAKSYSEGEGKNEVTKLSNTSALVSTVDPAYQVDLDTINENLKEALRADIIGYRNIAIDDELETEVKPWLILHPKGEEAYKLLIDIRLLMKRAQDEKGRPYAVNDANDPICLVIFAGDPEIPTSECEDLKNFHILGADIYEKWNRATKLIYEAKQDGDNSSLLY